MFLRKTVLIGQFPHLHKSKMAEKVPIMLTMFTIDPFITNLYHVLKSLIHSWITILLLLLLPIVSTCTCSSAKTINNTRTSVFLQAMTSLSNQ